MIVSHLLHAAQNDVIALPDLQGQVQGISALSVVKHDNHFSNIGQTEIVQKVFSIIINSNNPDGFKLILESYFLGRISRYEEGQANQVASLDNDGNFLKYDIALKLGNNGYLGFRDNYDSPVLPQSLSNYEYPYGSYSLLNPLDMYFTSSDVMGNVVSATVNGELEIWLKMPVKINLLRGTFKDFLSCTIIDL